MEIIRKDGITYERKPKIKNLDCSLTIRFSRENIEKLKTISELKGIKYNTLVRNIIEEYIRRIV